VSAATLETSAAYHRSAMPFPSWESGAIGCVVLVIIGIGLAVLILWII
jgi:hypothetical protein